MTVVATVVVLPILIENVLIEGTTVWVVFETTTVALPDLDKNVTVEGSTRLVVPSNAVVEPLGSPVIIEVTLEKSMCFPGTIGLFELWEPVTEKVELFPVEVISPAEGEEVDPTEANDVAWADDDRSTPDDTPVLFPDGNAEETTPEDKLVAGLDGMAEPDFPVKVETRK